MWSWATSSPSLTHFHLELIQIHGFKSCLCLVAQSCPALCNMDWDPPGFFVHRDSPGKNTGVGCHALLQEIFSTQGLNPGLPYCRRIFYLLSHTVYSPVPFPSPLPLPTAHSTCTGVSLNIPSSLCTQGLCICSSLLLDHPSHRLVDPSYGSQLECH